MRDETRDKEIHVGGRTTRRAQTPARHVKLILALGTLGAAVAVTLGVATAATVGIVPQYTPGKSGSAGGPVIAGQKGHSHCGEPGYPACPTLPDTWVPVASSSRADVLTALQSCREYMPPPRAALAPDSSPYAFDDPVIVKPATRGQAGDFYNMPHLIIRASVNGVRQVTYDVVYDPAHKQLRLSSIGQQLSNDPYFGKSFPWDGVLADKATSILHAARGLGLAPSTAPELVFFQSVGPSGKGDQANLWMGGGFDPADPIWRLTGSDGHVHFVGVDGEVYEPNQLPLDSGVSILEP